MWFVDGGSGHGFKMMPSLTPKNPPYTAKENSTSRVTKVERIRSSAPNGGVPSQDPTFPPDAKSKVAKRMRNGLSFKNAVLPTHVRRSPPTMPP